VWAADSAFGERVAQGMLVLSCALGLVELDPERVVAMRRISSATFKAPVLIGDTIRVAGEVRGLRPVDRSTALVETSWRVANQHGRAVAVFSAELLWRRGES
jgi:acyl dehydratase